MARRNHPTHVIKGKLTDRYDTDVCWLPDKPHIKAVVVHPLKVIFRNMDAYPWAFEKKEVRSCDDPLFRAATRDRW